MNRRGVRRRATLEQSSVQWRLILGDGSPPAPPVVPVPDDGPTNMAVDQALLDAVAAGASPVLRLYRWSQPTLSFGRNQPARGLYDEEAATARGIALVRRPTGGQAVLHDDELTYAVVAPMAALGKPREAYRRINEALVAALRGLGVDAHVAARGAEAGRVRGVTGGASWTRACFRQAERGEVVVQGRKLVGSAQRLQSRTILQHGSILIGGTQSPAEALLVHAPGASRAAAALPEAPEVGEVGEVGWTTLTTELDERPALDALVAAVTSGFEEIVGISLARTTLSPEGGAGRVELRERFASRAWTWRR